MAYNGWPMLFDPYLEAIRNEPEFEALANELDEALAEMAGRVADAEQSGNWDQLRAMVEST